MADSKILLAAALLIGLGIGAGISTDALTLENLEDVDSLEEIGVENSESDVYVQSEIDEAPYNEEIVFEAEVSKRSWSVDTGRGVEVERYVIDRPAGNVVVGVECGADLDSSGLARLEGELISVEYCSCESDSDLGGEFGHPIPEHDCSIDGFECRETVELDTFVCGGSGSAENIDELY